MYNTAAGLILVEATADMSTESGLCTDGTCCRMSHVDKKTYTPRHFTLRSQNGQLEVFKEAPAAKQVNRQFEVIRLCFSCTVCIAHIECLLI
ncbi:hypothetical protein JOB18_021694 [Solea senegalensis]|uniref:Uncharacterized protein n=1 Tax=Solea senegalensis TaxID=28829 RepID=A0AAV6Q5Z4_SOLSE|nr:hypothetical protein JOB18_021694 [Solea senegalensis]